MDIVYPISRFQLTQIFGDDWYMSNGQLAYKSMGLAGHNGWDFRTAWDDSPSGKRPVLAPCPLEFYATGNDVGGYGNYVMASARLESVWMLTFGHLDATNAFTRLSTGGTVGVSDNTGFSTGPHLHLTCKRGSFDADGKWQTLAYDNGFKGAIDPQVFFDETLRWRMSHGDIINTMDDFQTTGFKLLDAYRAVRKTEGGAEGNWESFARSVIEVDKKYPGVLASKASLETQMSATLGILDVKLAAIESMKDQIKALETKISELSSVPAKVITVYQDKKFLKPLAQFFYGIANALEG